MQSRKTTLVTALLKLCVLFLLLAFSDLALAQNVATDNSGQTQPANSASDASTETIGESTKLFLKGVPHDQLAIWTSPARIHYKDLAWLLPLGAATGVLIATDRDVAHEQPSSPTFASHSTTVSNVGLGALVGTGAILFFDGHIVKDQHAAETGRLAAEAAVNSLIFNVVVQQITQRQRPFAPTHPGQFFEGGNAFPSTHAALSWSIATILEKEYPNNWTRFLGYGTAAAVSTTRLLGRDHSASDVFVGSAAGVLIGLYTYHHHHGHRLNQITGSDATPASQTDTAPSHSANNSTRQSLTATPLRGGAPYLR